MSKPCPKKARSVPHSKNNTTFNQQRLDRRSQNASTALKESSIKADHGSIKAKKSSKAAHLLLKGGHAWHKQHGRELNGSLHVEVRSGQRLQELLEGRLEEGIVLILAHLHCQDDVSTEAPRKLLKMQNSKFLCLLCENMNSRM